jgi:alpha-1,4-digalacturonate transport system substrate-binding protein
VPAHLGLSKIGIEFDTDNPLAKHALETFAGAVPCLFYSEVNH